MRSTRAVLLAVLLAAYASMFVRVPGRLDERGRLDPMAPRSRALERLVEERKFSEALPLAIELRAAYPTEPLVAYWMASIYHGLGRTDAEVDAWETYNKISMMPVESCPALPEAYARTGRQAQAREAFERCAALLATP